MEKMNIDIAIEQAISKVRELYAKYQDDDYMILKTHNYICFQLDGVFEHMKKTHEQSMARIKEMTMEQDNFVHNFLNTNQYFYVASTEKFIMYDGINYHIRSEDDILHHVLSTISKERQLMPWKKSTKINVMKRIKETSIFKTVPESETIQHVLDALSPALFKSRAEAKYFLTVIGDNLLRKNTELVHFITPKAKQFIRELSNISQLVLGVNAGNTFKYKYYLHDYNLCRLVNINSSVQSETIWGAVLQKGVMDILCVACHYSTRYSTSDEFVLYNSNDDDLEHHVFFMKHNSAETLVKQFAQEYFQQRDTPSIEGAVQSIDWKDIMYLWKHYLDGKQLPNVMFQPTLKQYLKELLGNKFQDQTQSGEYLEGYTSKYLPTIQSFLAFWDETIVIDTSDTAFEYEVDELCILYKKWCDIKKKHHSISEPMMLDLIQYYFAGLSIENNKNVTGIRCSLWDKQMDVQIAMDVLKTTLQQNSNDDNTIELRIVSSYSNLSEMAPPSPSSTGSNKPISVYDAYVWYCKYYSEIGDKRPLVSKLYFENIVSDYML